MKTTHLVFLSILIVGFAVTSLSAQDPWGANPTWKSTDWKFTMSIAIEQIVDDAALDIIAGNYDYPYGWVESPKDLQLEEIGDNVYGYTAYETIPPIDGYTFADPVPLINYEAYTDVDPLCIDCIAVADFDNENGPDIAIGAVVGRGNDGGVFVLINQGGNDWDNKFNNSLWSPTGQTRNDCHCVRWVDFDSDGDLDLAALEVGGYLRIYQNDETSSDPVCKLNPVPLTYDFRKACDFSRYYERLGSNPSDDLSDDPFPYEFAGTTMEFGDMDQDGDFDLYINTAGPPRVFINRYDELPPGEEERYYSEDHFWTDPNVTKESQFCGSFGFLDGNRQYMALAIGSSDWLYSGDPGNETYRNDIYIYNGANLEHKWQSEEFSDSDSGSPPAEYNFTQFVTDIQWANIDNDANGIMDLVTASYPTWKETFIGSNAYRWDKKRGREALYTNPVAETIQPWDWSNESEFADLSTCHAIGDINGSFTNLEIESVSIDPPYNNRIIYADHWPIHEIVYVHYEDGSGQPVGEPSWTCDKQNGWISVGYDATPPGVVLVVKYKYSKHLDLIVGNDGYNVLYSLMGGPAYSPTSSNYITECVPPTPHTYDPSVFIGEHPSLTDKYSALAPDAICGRIGGFSGYPEPDLIKEFLEDHPYMTRIEVGAHWPDLAMFQGHYFWDNLDRSVQAIYDISPSGSRDGILVSMQQPSWTLGNWVFDPTEAPYDRWERPSDEKLHTMYVRALVNRYRPSGIYTNEYCGDWGIELFHFDNEPDHGSHKFGKHFVNQVNPANHNSYIDDPIDKLAERLFREYQVVKEIAKAEWGEANKHRLKLISPNWGTSSPLEYENGYEVQDDCYAFNAGPMPYLHAVNDADLSSLGLPNGRIIEDYTDFICQQAYCGAVGKPVTEGVPNGVVDPFNQLDGGPEVPVGLKFGIENIFWGYYTDGLEDHYDWAGGETTETDWSPLFETLGEEHPFFMFEYGFFEELTGFMNEEVRNDLECASLAEMFSVDVYPLLDVDYYPLAYAAECWIFDDNGVNEYNAIAKMLNDRSPGSLTGPCNPATGSHTWFVDGNIDPNPSDDPDVYWLTFEKDYYGLIADNDTASHFIKTSWDYPYPDPPHPTISPADKYVQNGYPYDHLQLPHTFPNTPKVDCYSLSGTVFQKEVVSPGKVVYAPGEMGPNMVILQENNTAGRDYTQTMQLHEKWNLVSWNIWPSGTPDEFQRIDVMLPLGSWIEDNPGGEVYYYLRDDIFWPPNVLIGEENWNVHWAYYLNMNGPYTWRYENKPEIGDGSVAFDLPTSDVWDGHEGTLIISQYADNWFFIGYSADGYTKLASIPNDPRQNPDLGNPGEFEYEGPFHSLIYNPGQSWVPWSLKVIKDDDGNAYIPIPDSGFPSDDIGYLEPGRGYFLGFADEGTYPFSGWADWPQWQNQSSQSVDPDPKGNQATTASSNHFTFNKHTHWSYPVYIDTVDQNECPMESGDEIGIFDGDRCVGSRLYSGEFPLVVTCWEDDIATPTEVDGYTDGNTMTFIWYDQSENAEIEFVPPALTASKEEDDRVAPQYAGFGMGLYAYRSFMDGISDATYLPKSFSLKQNYPNPFNSTTVIPLELPQRSRVVIDLYDVCGRLVWSHNAGVLNAGWPQVHFNASNLASGVYFYRVTATGLERGGRYIDVGKMLLLK